MKGGLTLALLEIISETAHNAGDFLTAFLNAGYGASRGKLEYEARKHRRARDRDAFAHEKEQLLRNRYRSLVYKLTRDGLLQNEQRGAQTFFRITAKGIRTLKRLRERKRNTPLPRRNYPIETTHQLIIIAFDIPEAQRKKRDWLRTVLRNLGMTMVQQSVWMGKVKIPKQLLDDLLELKIIECVEIFEISKGGSLRHMP